jgi:hypothetical protein
VRLTWRAHLSALPSPTSSCSPDSLGQGNRHDSPRAHLPRRGSVLFPPRSAFKREPQPFTASLPVVSRSSPSLLSSRSPAAAHHRSTVRPPRRSLPRASSVCDFSLGEPPCVSLPLLAPSILRFVVSRAVLHELWRAHPWPAVAGAPRAFHRPCFAPGWVRHPPLFAPELLFLKMTSCSTRASNAGELHAAVMAAPPRSPPALAAGSLSPPFFLS